MNIDNSKILKEIALQVYSEVHPLLGTDKSRQVIALGFGGDETTYIDKIAEEKILDYLRKERLNCVHIGEEQGIQYFGKNPNFYLVSDAIDGTTNATRGIGFVSISLAISEIDRFNSLNFAVVMNLVDGSIYEASKGKGSWHDGRRMKVSSTTNIENAILSFDVSHKPEAVDLSVPLMKKVKNVRSLGSAALETCYVASGQLDAYVDLRKMLRPFDIAAGKLILEEAGGFFLQPNGKGFEGYSLTELNRFSVVAAANRHILRKICKMISRYSSVH